MDNQPGWLPGCEMQLNLPFETENHADKNGSLNSLTQVQIAVGMLESLWTSYPTVPPKTSTQPSP